MWAAQSWKKRLKDLFSYVCASLALLLKLMHEGASLPDAALVLNLTVASVWSDGFS